MILRVPNSGNYHRRKKADCLPLMIADFQAHASSISDARLKSGRLGYFEMVGEARPPRGQAAITRIELTAEALRAHKANWAARRQEGS